MKRLLALLLFLPLMAQADESLRIAVAANFRAPLQQLIHAYQQSHPNTRIQFSSGSSGTLYQQILHGAPYQLYLSANAFYPQQLQKQLSQQGKATQLDTYALGQLVLWHPHRSINTLNDLQQPSLTLAIANPKTAPYGRAAKQVLSQLSGQAPKVVRGHSISQAHQFVASGNAQAGFVALSQVLDQTGNTLLIDPALYQPIQQQMLLLDQEHNIAANFYHFLLSEQGQALIQSLGYLAPTPKERKLVTR